MEKFQRIVYMCGREHLKQLITFRKRVFLDMAQEYWSSSNHLELACPTMSYWNHIGTVGYWHLYRIDTILCHCWFDDWDTVWRKFSMFGAILWYPRKIHTVYRSYLNRTIWNRQNVHSIPRRMYCQMNQIHWLNALDYHRQRQTPQLLSTNE